VTAPQPVRGTRVGTGGPSYPIRDYVYRGNQPLAADPKSTRTPSPICEEAGCDRDAHAVRLCVSHYWQYRKALKADPSLLRTRPKQGFTPDKCGTQAGYQRHTYHNHPPCDPCIKAQSADRAKRKAAQAQREAAQ
jgi:hypothetical protein